MEERFHIGRDGQPHKCTAKPGRCPLGGEHYPTYEDAEKAAEDNARPAGSEMRLSKAQDSPKKKNDGADRPFKVRKWGSAQPSYETDGREYDPRYQDFVNENLDKLDDRFFETVSRVDDPSVYDDKTADSVMSIMAGLEDRLISRLDFKRSLFNDDVEYYRKYRRAPKKWSLYYPEVKSHRAYFCTENNFSEEYGNGGAFSEYGGKAIPVLELFVRNDDEDRNLFSSTGRGSTMSRMKRQLRQDGYDGQAILIMRNRENPNKCILTSMDGKLNMTGSAAIAKARSLWDDWDTGDPETNHLTKLPVKPVE